MKKRRLLDPGVVVAVPRTWRDFYDRDLDEEARAWVEDGVVAYCFVAKVGP